MSSQTNFGPRMRIHEIRPHQGVKVEENTYNTHIFSIHTHTHKKKQQTLWIYITSPV